jgi:hypothetical protein
MNARAFMDAWRIVRYEDEARGVLNFDKESPIPARVAFKIAFFSAAYD